MKIKLSNGAEYEGRLEVWDDYLSGSNRAYRLFWASPDGRTGVPAVGYCSEGAHRTIRAAVADGLRRFGERAVRA